MKTFIESQFNHCPLLWMFHNRTMNNTINRLHKRALRVIYNDEKNDKFSFKDLLDQDGAMSIHDRNLHKLANEMYNVKNDLSLPIQELSINQANRYDFRKKEAGKCQRLRQSLMVQKQ